MRHVDYGTVDTVECAKLRPLRRDWARLPAQAVRACLAGVRPSAGGSRWPHSTSEHFLRTVCNMRLVAKVVAVDPMVSARLPSRTYAHAWPAGGLRWPHATSEHFKRRVRHASCGQCF